MTDTDDLLNEATRLADRLHDVDPPEVRVLRALVERVRAAEAGEREARERMASNGYLAMRMEAERDSARAKRDTVRALADEPSPDNDWGWGYDAAMADVLAILDGPVRRSGGPTDAPGVPGPDQP